MRGAGRGAGQADLRGGQGRQQVAQPPRLLHVLAPDLPFPCRLVTIDVVDAVRTVEGLEELDIRIKWPNDISLSSALADLTKT